MAWRLVSAAVSRPAWWSSIKSRATGAEPRHHRCAAPGRTARPPFAHLAARTSCSLSVRTLPPWQNPIPGRGGTSPYCTESTPASCVRPRHIARDANHRPVGGRCAYYLRWRAMDKHAGEVICAGRQPALWVCRDSAPGLDDDGCDVAGSVQFAKSRARQRRATLMVQACSWKLAAVQQTGTSRTAGSSMSLWSDCSSQMPGGHSKRASAWSPLARFQVTSPRNNSGHELAARRRVVGPISCS